MRLNHFVLYLLSWVPLSLVLGSPHPELFLLLLLFPVIPVLGAFYRQLRPTDGLVASFGWSFLSFVLSFETFSMLAVLLVVLWGVHSLLFIHRKELRIRKLEHECILINFRKGSKPMADWPTCPIDRLQTWYTMVQGIVKQKPMPVRVLLFEDYSLRTAGLAFETWYEVVVILNKDLLRRLPPQAQTALAAKQFAHLLRRDFTGLKDELYWWGHLTGWFFATVAILIPAGWEQLIFGELVGQVTITVLGLVIGVVLLQARLRHQEYQADVRAADLTQLDDLYTAYEEWLHHLPVEPKSGLLGRFRKRLSPVPPLQKRMDALRKLGEVVDAEETLVEPKTLV